MSANIEALVAKHFNPYAIYGTEHLDHMRNALTELSETHALELRAYEATVAELQRRVDEAQSVPVVGEPDCYDAGLLNDFGGGNVEWWQDYIRAELARAHDFYASWLPGAITAAELATLREKAAEADELRKKLAAYDRLNKELDAAIAQGKGE